MSVIQTVHSLSEFLSIIEDDLKNVMIDEEVIDKWHNYKIVAESKKDKDELKIKRATGWTLFYKERNSILYTKFPADELRGVIANEWNSMTRDEKDCYKLQAKQLNENNFQLWKKNMNLNKKSQSEIEKLTPKIIETFDKNELSKYIFSLDVEFDLHETKSELKKKLVNSVFKYQKSKNKVEELERTKKLKRKLES